MHYGADMCLPRKKKVIQSFRSNTHRIFDEKVPDRLDANKIYNHHTYQRRTSEEINQLKTHNIPHPRNAKYIRSNVRFLNEPMAYIDVQFQQLVLQVPRNHCWRRYVSFISLIQGNHRTKHMKESIMGLLYGVSLQLLAETTHSWTQAHNQGSIKHEEEME